MEANQQKELISRPSLSDEEALTAKVICKERAGGHGDVVSRLVGKCYDVYLIQVKYKEKSWIVRRRFREIDALNRDVKDAELKAIMPPKSFCAKVGLPCAVEIRQSRLGCYINELTHKFMNEPAKQKILEFLEAIPKQRSNTPVIDITVHRPVSPSSEQCLFAVTPRGTIRKRADGSLSADQRDQLDPKAKEAYARLFRALVNGVNLIKHCQGRGSSKRRLLFCNEDFSTLYWAAGRRNPKSMAVKDIYDVREGTAPDPDHPGEVGTATLRKNHSRRLSSSNQQWIFSIISTSRNLDLQALNEEDYWTLVDGFCVVASLSTLSNKKGEEALPPPSAVGALEEVDPSSCC